MLTRPTGLVSQDNSLADQNVLPLPPGYWPVQYQIVLNEIGVDLKNAYAPLGQAVTLTCFTTGAREPDQVGTMGQFFSVSLKLLIQIYKSGSG